MKALMIVDMVRGFVEPETKDGKCKLYLPEAHKIIPAINELCKEHDLVIFASDCHEPDDKEFNVYPPHCIKSTDEIRPATGLQFNGQKAFLVLKTRFSAFFKTGLEKYLIDNAITELTIVGVCTEICILFTTADAVMRNIKVTVPSNAVSGLTPEGHEWALKYMKGILGVNVI